jgi:FkbM family methyltransferase
MQCFLYNKAIDLVDFEDLKLFMLKNDNLYNIAVSEERKNQSLSQYQDHVRQDGYPRSLVTPESVDGVSSSRFGLYLFVQHLWEHRGDLTILDIGSHIGDFSLKMGNFIRTWGKACRVISFDPTEAGVLVDYNVELNGLNEIVRHEDLAVAEFDGLMLFDYSPGQSDSTHAAEITRAGPTGRASRFQAFQERSLREKLVLLMRFGFRRVREMIERRSPAAPSYNFIARAVDIVGYLDRNGLNGDLFVKIDIEGIDTRVIDRLLTLLPSRLISIVFEFAPRSFADDDAAASYLAHLNNSFHMFDLFYSPNPTRFRLIEEQELRVFISDVRERRYRYTDIFLLDRRTPNCDQLAGRLSRLRESPDEIRL